MNRSLLLWSALVTVLIALPLVAQPVSVTVNGMSSGSTITQGDVLSWQITLPMGAVSFNELWVDVNTNGQADLGTDRLMGRFTQEDGVQFADGPGDNDGIANGVITTQFPAGIASAAWVFVAADSLSSDTASFTVLPLPSPAAQITGTITAPAGFDKSYILVEAKPYYEGGGGGGMDVFWQGLTDISGNYTINLGGTPTDMNPWRVQLTYQDLGRLVWLRRDTSVNVGGATPVVNFQLVLGTILTGIVRNTSAVPLEGAYPHTHDPSSINEQNQFGGNTGPDGRFSFAVPSGSYKLHFTREGYFDQWWNAKTSFDGADVIVVSGEDTIGGLDGTLVQGAEIRGRVTNYGSPTNASITVTRNGDSWMMNTYTHDDGTWSVTVSPGTYYVRFDKESQTIYYDNMYSPPGTPINISGTETISNVDADFSVGPPPPPPAPVILNIWDVPFDNGRQVYVRWRGSESGSPIGTDGPPLGIEFYTLWRWDPSAGWLQLERVEASHDSVYTAIVPSLRDSTLTDGMYWSKYRVKSHYSYNFYVISSMPDSGYSLDNLAPNVPGGAASIVAGSDLLLRWHGGAEDDFRYFSVYRSLSADFSITGMAPYVRTTDTTFTDAGMANSGYYYKITATDHSGNQSPPTIALSSTGATSSETTETLPVTYALRQNFPNPFNPSTQIVFDLPLDEAVQVTVYNALGQHVANVFDGRLPAGRHAVTFDATGLPSGLYVCRLQAGKFSAMRKMSFVK